MSLPETPDPVAPKEFDTPVPVQDGESLYVSIDCSAKFFLSQKKVGEDCNDPETGLQALINKAKWGDTIYIPTDVLCSGAFEYPAKGNN